MEIPPGSLVLGSPAKVVKTLSKEDQQGVRYWAEKYIKVSRKFMARENEGKLMQGDPAREILVVDACGAKQNLQNEQNFPMG